MGRFIPSKYRYPMFFVGIAIMSIAGFVQRYAKTKPEFTVISVAVGFVLFVASVAVP